MCPAIVESQDIEILMHRDVHFGGNFSIMIEYYEGHGVGVMPDFSLERIQNLSKLEKNQGSNLADTLLTEQARELLQRSKRLYLELREAYETKNRAGVLISDLIFSEDEDPEKEIKAIEKEGKSMVPLLHHILESSDFYDPLFPGYGRAPILAAKCLEALKSTASIPILFGALGYDNFFTDEAMIDALKNFGEESKTFLLKRLTQKPINRDNEKAALVLNNFSESSIARTSFEMLNDPDSIKNPTFCLYLIFNCAYLEKKEEQELYKQWLKKSALPPHIQEEASLILKLWKK